jgi:hypothetical protein
VRAADSFVFKKGPFCECLHMIETFMIETGCKAFAVLHILKWSKRNSEDSLMRKVLVLIAAVTVVSAVSLSSHRAEAIVPVAPTSIQAAAKAANSILTIACASRRVCTRGVCTVRRVCT